MTQTTTPKKPSRYELKASEIMELWEEAEKAPDGLYYALVEAYNRGYNNGMKAQKSQTRIKRGI